jgi:hypothetical protein
MMCYRTSSPSNPSRFQQFISDIHLDFKRLEDKKANNDDKKKTKVSKGTVQL